MDRPDTHAEDHDAVAADPFALVSKLRLDLCLAAALALGQWVGLEAHPVRNFVAVVAALVDKTSYSLGHEKPIFLRLLLSALL